MNMHKQYLNIVPVKSDNTTDIIAKAMNTSTMQLDKRLRHKIAQLESSLARVANTRQMLNDNAAHVRKEINACFAHQQQCLRSRENVLQTDLTQMMQSKLDILKEQQAYLTDMIDECKELIGTGNSRRSTAILQSTSPRCESAIINFDADTMALRSLLQNFGSITTTRPFSESSSLPLELEDYEDERQSVILQHKTFSDATSPITNKWLLGGSIKDDKELQQRLVSLEIAKKVTANTASFTEYFAKVLAQPNHCWLLSCDSSDIDSDQSSFDLCRDTHADNSHCSSLIEDWLHKPLANANRQSTIETILVAGDPKKYENGIPFADVFRSVLDSDPSLWLHKNADMEVDFPQSEQADKPNYVKEPSELNYDRPVIGVFNEKPVGLPLNPQTTDSTLPCILPGPILAFPDRF